MNGQKNAKNNIKAVIFSSLAASGNRKAYKFISAIVLYDFLPIPTTNLPKGVSSYSPVPQGNILFKLSSHIYKKYVATLITNIQGFHFHLE